MVWIEQPAIVYSNPKWSLGRLSTTINMRRKNRNVSESECQDEQTGGVSCMELQKSHEDLVKRASGCILQWSSGPKTATLGLWQDQTRI